MKRADVLAAIKAAGTRNDHQAYARLYCENRVSYEAAKAAFTEGQRWAAFVRKRDVQAKESTTP